MAALNTNIKDTAQGLRVYVLNVHKTHCFTEHLVAVRPAEALRGDTGDSKYIPPFSSVNISPSLIYCENKLPI